MSPLNSQHNNVSEQEILNYFQDAYFLPLKNAFAETLFPRKSPLWTYLQNYSANIPWEFTFTVCL